MIGGVQEDAIGTFGGQESAKLVPKLESSSRFPCLRGDEEIVEPLEALHGQAAEGVELGEGQRPPASSGSS